ncbi:hypothetical protein RHGRI_020817 [Rhododendron griersonianum]|uniref:Nuclear pore complex protein Nup85 n=1 Tax=Rhododendron griersonianum TaxID=479676 RepID=A0AAV6JQ71_9ERIC|nr:hypothetical protein RHGRI_020817 [Rhododendron griersonianum]
MKMPGLTSDPGETSLVPFSSEVGPVVYPLRHGLKPPIAARFSISWSRGNSLRVSGFQSEADDGEVVRGKVVEVKLGSGDSEIDHAQWRRIAYGSVSPFALLQSHKNSMAAVSKMSAVSSPYDAEWSDYVMEYSRDIGFLLGGHKLSLSVGIEDTKTVLKKVEEPTCLKAAWELMVIFYADHKSQAWTPEQLVDWLADYDSLLSGTQPTVHSKLVNFQKELASLQAIEDDDKYWEAISSALAVGWLDVAVSSFIRIIFLFACYYGNNRTHIGSYHVQVKMLRLHGSYQLNQVGSREVLFCLDEQIENGLVEAVAVLISKMPHMRLELAPGKLGECFGTKPDFIKGLESMNNLAQKCMQLKPVSFPHKLMTLLLGILGENTEVVLAECSRSFGPWMVVHAAELLAAGNTQMEILLHEERHNLGGISMEELHRLVYAQVLSSHALTWQIAPIYLASCTKQGMALLKILLYKQPVHHNQILLKNIEICRLYELHKVSSKMMKIAGVHHWKHGKKGSGVFWLQQARDEIRLSRIAQQLFDFVGKSISDESFKQWEGLIELLGSESRIAGGLEFLHKYVHDGIATNSAQKAAESLILLMKNPSTPQRFWLPLLYDSLKLLNWQEHPLLNVSQTNLLLNKLQELSIVARLRPDFTEADLPSQALSSVRLALATNLGRAILEE